MASEDSARRAGATMQQTKVAVIRDSSVPPGRPAPLHLNCPCGAKPKTELGGPNVRCSCGRTYTSSGWRVK